MFSFRLKVKIHYIVLVPAGWASLAAPGGDRFGTGFGEEAADRHLSDAAATVRATHWSAGALRRCRVCCPRVRCPSTQRMQLPIFDEAGGQAHGFQIDCTGTVTRFSRPCFPELPAPEHN